MAARHRDGRAASQATQTRKRVFWLAPFVGVDFGGNESHNLRLPREMLAGGLKSRYGIWEGAMVKLELGLELAMISRGKQPQCNDTDPRDN